MRNDKGNEKVMPIFGAKQAIEERLAVLRQLLKSLEKREIRILEVGSYEGQSMLSWADAIGKYCAAGEVVCIDPWRPYFSDRDAVASPHYERMQLDLVTGQARQRFLSNCALAHPAATITHHVGTLISVAMQIDLGQFDIVYIDGSHYYRAVKQDIHMGMRLVKNGGILCGDDLDRVIGDVDQAHMIENCERDFVDGYHPGVTRAVGEQFPDVWMECGVWAMKKVSDEVWEKPRGI